MKVKIAHLHVWDQKNKGDRAIVLAVQELLRLNFPGCLISDFPISLLKKGYKNSFQDKPGNNGRGIKKINQADLVIIGGGGIFYSYFYPMI